ncbi:conjugal transfer protein TrbE, partial [Candidatus Magnetomorum sp. HK-1]
LNAFSKIEKGWSLWVDEVKTHFHYKGDSCFKTHTHKLLEQDRMRNKTDNYYKSQLYITFVYNPGINDSSDLIKKTDQNINDFETTINKIIGALTSILFFTELSRDETAQYLHQSISGEKKIMRWNDHTHDFSDGLIHKEVAKNPAMIGDKYIVVVGIKQFPPASMPEITKRLNNVGCNYRQVIRLIFKDRSKAIDDLEARERRWVESDQKILPGIWNFFNRRNESTIPINDAIKEKAGNCYGLKQLLIMGKTNVCDYTHNFILTGTDKQQLSKEAEFIIAVLNVSGFAAFLETKNTLAAWLGSLPGNMNNPRKHPMSITHLSDLLPISTKYHGKQQNSLGLPALSIVNTEDTEPFWLSLDGHTMMIGPTGSGKSFALCAIMSFFYRYQNAQIFAFDKGGSLKNTTHYFEGKDIDLSKHFIQPLRNLDTKQDFDWAVEWIITLINNQLDDRSGIIRNSIIDSLKSLKRRPKEERTLSGFMNFTNTEIREVLSHYKDSVLDGVSNDICANDWPYSITHDWFCFEMGSLLENNSETVVPVLLYLFYMIEKRLDKESPTLIVLDEVWLYLENTIFSQRIRLWLKTLRKMWGYVVFATQEIDDLQESSIYTSLENSTQTEIWLPNKKAKKDKISKFYTQSGLSTIEIEQIATKTPRQDYFIKQPEGSRWIQLSNTEFSKIVFGCEQTLLTLDN